MINTKESMYRTERKDMAFSLGMQETSIREIIETTKEKDMGRCIGLMVVIIKVNGTKEYSKAKVICTLM